MPWIPTANPPIQSSPSGSMKSARHMFGRPSRFFTCWRRKGTRTQSLPARTSTSSPSRWHRHRPTVADGVSQRSAMIWSSIALASSNRLRALSPTTGSSRICGIIAGQLPGAEEGRPVDRGAEIAQRPFAEMVEAREQRRRRLALRIERKCVGAGLVEARQILGPAALARLREAPHIRRRVAATSGSRWVSLIRLEATPTARLASRTWITGPS